MYGDNRCDCNGDGMSEASSIIWICDGDLFGDNTPMTPPIVTIDAELSSAIVPPTAPADQDPVIPSHSDKQQQQQQQTIILLLLLLLLLIPILILLQNNNNKTVLRTNHNQDPNVVHGFQQVPVKEIVCTDNIDEIVMPMV